MIVHETIGRHALQARGQLQHRIEFGHLAAALHEACDVVRGKCLVGGNEHGQPHQLPVAHRQRLRVQRDCSVELVIRLQQVGRGYGQQAMVGQQVAALGLDRCQAPGQFVGGHQQVL